MSSPDRGDDPHESPAVGVKHGQRPEVAVADCDVEVDQRAHDVCPGVPVGDHDALRFGGGAARVVDGEQIGLCDLGSCEIRLGGSERSFVLRPPFAAPGAAQADEVLDAAKLIAHPFDRIHIIRVHTQHLRPRVRGDVDEVIRRQPVVDRHQDRTDLRHRIERLELLVSVGSDVGHAVAPAHTQRLQHG